MKSIKCTCDMRDSFWTDDDFLELPAEAQAAFFHLLMWADDKGNVRNPKAVSRMAAISEETLKMLADCKFIEEAV